MIYRLDTLLTLEFLVAIPLCCTNWDCSRKVPFLGIFVSNFWYCVFVMCIPESIKTVKEAHAASTLLYPWLQEKDFRGTNMQLDMA
jgi:hypothetical protein